MSATLAPRERIDPDEARAAALATVDEVLRFVDRLEHEPGDAARDTAALLGGLAAELECDAGRYLTPARCRELGDRAFCLLRLRDRLCQ